MKAFRVQLFATASDLSNWCARWAQPSDTMLGFDRSGRVLLQDLSADIESAFADEAVRWVAMVAGAPGESGSVSVVSDVSSVREALVFEIGRAQGAVLSESSVFSMSPTKRWQDCRAELRKGTRSGCVVRNDRTGAEGPSRVHRYTDAAVALLSDGVEWRQCPQMNTVFRPQMIE